jgi:cAMP-dependent protein kinase regulator
MKEKLKKVYFLRDLDDEALSAVQSVCSLRTFSKGDKIIEEGEESYSIFIIIDGKVHVYKRDISGAMKFMDELGSGNFFGEISFLTGKPRTATVVAAEDCTLYEISKDDMERLEESYPQIKSVLVDFYKIRILDSLIAFSPLFSELDADDRKYVLTKFKPDIYQPNQVIIQEGTEGDFLFVIKSGKVLVKTKDIKGREIKLAELGPGDFFGEVALITNTPRTATVVAITKVGVLKMSKEDFLEIIQLYPSVLEKGIEYVKRRAEDTITILLDARKGRYLE